MTAPRTDAAPPAGRRARLRAAQSRAVAALLERRWSLLALFGGVLVPLLLFGSLGEDILEGDAFPWDAAILRALHARATPGLDSAAIALSRVGGPLVMTGIVVAVILVLLRRARRGAAAFVGVAVGGATALNFVAKLAFQRQRPDLWLSLRPEQDYGFPSGHAMGSMALFVALAIVLWRTRWRWPFLVLGGAFVAGVGLSRLYLGVHFPSDVLAGWCASLAWVSGVRALATVPHLPWSHRPAGGQEGVAVGE